MLRSFPLLAEGKFPAGVYSRIFFSHFNNVALHSNILYITYFSKPALEKRPSPTKSFRKNYEPQKSRRAQILQKTTFLDITWWNVWSCGFVSKQVSGDEFNVDNPKHCGSVGVICSHTQAELRDRILARPDITSILFFGWTCLDEYWFKLTYARIILNAASRINISLFDQWLQVVYRITSLQN